MVGRRGGGLYGRDVGTGCAGVGKLDGTEGIATASSCWIARFPTIGAPRQGRLPRLFPLVLALTAVARSHLLPPPRRSAGSCTYYFLHGECVCRYIPGVLLTYWGSSGHQRILISGGPSTHVREKQVAARPSPTDRQTARAGEEITEKAAHEESVTHHSDGRERLV